MWSRFAAERAFNNGRALTLADADRTNQTLAAYFPDVVSPPSADPKTIAAWFDKLIEEHIERRRSLIVDFGGGDLVLKTVAKEIPLVTFIEEHGIMPVALYFVGPDPDDAAYLVSMERDKLFAPKATIIVFNEYSVPDHMPEAEAFDQTVFMHPVIAQVLDRGGEIVRMPTLRAAHEIDRRRLSFFDAADGKTKGGLPPLGLMDRQRTATWLRQMEESFATVRHWLP